jgi:cysteine desulfurase
MIYLDHNSTTHLSLRAKEAMLRFTDKPLNPSSVHSLGRNAKFILEEARSAILRSLNFEKDYNLLFTSSGTEANNLVMKNFYTTEILISAVEHFSIYLHKKYNSAIKVINVDHNGLLDIEHLESLLQNVRPGALISVIYVNNETGVIQNLHDVIKVAKNFQALVHSDFSQALGKTNFQSKRYDLDFITVSGHKFGGPHGCAGLLYKKNLQLAPEIIGGGQERGLRSGTENVFAAIGMAEAAKELEDLEHLVYVETLRNKLEQNILSHCPDIQIASKNAARACNTSMIMMPNAASQLQLVQFDLRGFAISSGSACSSGKIDTSHVLLAMNYSKKQASNAIRVSLNKHNTYDEIDGFCQTWKEIFDKYN